MVNLKVIHRCVEIKKNLVDVNKTFLFEKILMVSSHPKIWRYQNVKYIKTKPKNLVSVFELWSVLWNWIYINQVDNLSRIEIP